MSIDLEPLLAASRIVDVHKLQAELRVACEHYFTSSFRVAVLSPFNHGKSTLINAMLGSRAMPIGLVPTTGAAVNIKYGTEVCTYIRKADGQEVRELGTEILQTLAIIDENRKMRENIDYVEVNCPHSLLRAGVELVDLPGTDDMEFQDEFIYFELLKVDLVIHVLDARKLFTLGEAEKTHEWLIARGITSSVFVLNFMNLLDSCDHEEVMKRAISIATRFRASLPSSINNLYRVDALPALRAKIMGETTPTENCSILAFESDLLNIIETLSSKVKTARLPRLICLAERMQQELQKRNSSLAEEMIALEAARLFEVEQLEADIHRIKHSLKQSLANLKAWSSLPNLLSKYETMAKEALQEKRFPEWQDGEPKKILTKFQDDITKYIYQLCDLLKCPRPNPLSISFPSKPSPTKPPKPEADEPTMTSVAIATGLGWLFGGPVGGGLAAGITAFVNENKKKSNAELLEAYRDNVDTIYMDAAKEYLELLSKNASMHIAELESLSDGVSLPQAFPEPRHLIDLRTESAIFHASNNSVSQWIESAKEYLKEQE